MSDLEVCSAPEIDMITVWKGEFILEMTQGLNKR